MKTAVDFPLIIDSLVVSLGGKKILENLDVRVESGQSVAIQGRSGSGKSTLLSTVLGLIRPTSGVLTVNGQNITELRRKDLARFRSSVIGMVFQGAELIESMTALENIILPALLAGTPRAEAYLRAAELLEDVAVPDSSTRARDLSGGERQRTALARALVNHPRLLLADEPTGALDVELRDSAARMLFAVPKETGCALVVVTHDPNVAALADVQYRLANGRLLLQDSLKGSV